MNLPVWPVEYKHQNYLVYLKTGEGLRRRRMEKIEKRRREGKGEVGGRKKRRKGERKGERKGGSVSVSSHLRWRYAKFVESCA